jgi:hypothetical protein
MNNNVVRKPRGIELDAKNSMIRAELARADVEDAEAPHARDGKPSTVGRDGKTILRSWTPPLSSSSSITLRKNAESPPGVATHAFSRCWRTSRRPTSAKTALPRFPDST